MRLVVADIADVTDVGGTAQTLADITGDDPAVIEAALRAGSAAFVVLSVAPERRHRDCHRGRRT